MQRLSLYALALAPLMTASGARAADLFTYQVEGFPAGALSCTAEAEALAGRIQSATGAAIYESHCDKDDQGVYAFSVSYVADRPMLLESTRPGHNIASQGTYAKLADCQAQLAVESSAFHEATGLTPIIAYCFPDFGGGGTYAPYLARIEAFGNAEVHSMSYAEVRADQPVGDLAALGDKVAEALRAQKLNVTHVTFDGDDDSYHRFVVHYYAATEASISTTTVTNYRNASYCGAQIDPVGKALHESGIEPMAVYCASGLYSSTELHLNVITANPAHALVLEEAPDNFTTLEACQQDRSRILAFYQGTLKRQAFAVVCGGVDGAAKATVLELGDH